MLLEQRERAERERLLQEQREREHRERMLAEQRERERILAEQRERERERMAIEMRERVIQVGTVPSYKRRYRIVDTTYWYLKSFRF